MHDYLGHTSLGLCFFSGKRVRTKKCCPTLQMLPTCTTLRTIDLNQWVSTFLMLQTFTTVPHVGWPQPWNYFRCCFITVTFLLLWYAGCLVWTLVKGSFDSQWGLTPTVDKHWSKWSSMVLNFSQSTLVQIILMILLLPTRDFTCQS